MSRNDESSSGSSDFFSPISISFFQNRNHLTDSVERTPQDSSWIGARLSPIQSFDREHDEEEDDVEDQQQRLHKTLESAPFVTERTKLLSQTTGAHPQQYLSRGGSQSRIHPLWDSPIPDSRRSIAGVPLPSCFSVDRVICIVSGINLFCMALFDTLETYRLFRTGRSDMGRFHIWSLPFFTPPQSTLRMFGALAPEYITTWRSRYIWGVLSSFFVSISITEWVLIFGAWKLIRLSSKGQGRPSLFGGIFLASCTAGQLWMWVYDSTPGRTVGAAAWGTSGVLCAAGVARPTHRFELYIVGSLLLLLSYLQRPSGSVWGATAGAFMGWVLGAAGCERVELKDHPTSLGFTRLVTFTGTVLSVGIIVSPVISLAFPESNNS